MANSAGTDQVPALFAMVEDELEQRLGSGSIYSGLTVTTTLNIGVQRAAEGAYAAGFDPGGLEADEAGRRPTGALVALDPGTGGVRAVVGGPDGEQINLAADNRRQPGSTFKLFALAAWLEQGRSADSYFDAPAVYTIPNLGDGQDYEVHNYGGSGHGEMSLRDATWQSVNTVYAQVWEQVGSPAFIDAARAAGIDADLPAGDPSLVLGTPAVSPLEVAEAFNTFAAGGVHHEPYVVEEIRRGDEVIYTRPRREERAFSTRTAAHVSDVLRGVVEAGTGTAAQIGRPAAGKTGTTQDYRDAFEGARHEVAPDRRRQAAARVAARHGVVGVAMAHPDHGGQVGGVAGEPGVAVVLRGAGLAGRRASDLRRGAGAGLHDAAQHVADVRRRAGGEGPFLAPRPRVDHLVAATDLLDDVGLVVDAAGREGVEGLGHLQGADRRGAEHQRRVAGGKVRVDAGGAGGVDEGRRADLLPDLGVDGVDRLPGGVAQAHLAVAGATVVVHLIVLAAAQVRDGVDRRGVEVAVRRPALLQPRGQGEELEG